MYTCRFSHEVKSQVSDLVIGSKTSIKFDSKRFGSIISKTWKSPEFCIKRGVVEAGKKK